MHLLPLILYACAAGAYLAHFAGRDRSIGRLATGLLGGAVLSHTFIIGMQTVQVGHAPLVGTTAAELPKIYDQISEELANQYSMAYSSKNPLRNGAWRRVVVRVAKPGLVARTRQGYYGPELVR